MPPTKTRRIIRLSVTAASYVLVALIFACIAFVYGWSRFAGSLPDLEGCHKDRPASEFEAHDAKPSYTFDDYLKQEDRVFAELDHLVTGPWSTQGHRVFDRYCKDSVCNPGAMKPNWNRTFILESPNPAGPIGGVLLLHGLSDSPYSLRALGQRLQAEGYTVIGLRIPGHGTCPKALAEVSWQDWAAAVRVASRGLRARIPKDRPLVMVGYSNGGALSVNYALEAAADPTLPRVDAMVLISPMIGISPAATILNLYPLIAKISGQPKIAWGGIEAEVDPYKYGSWPQNAGLQGRRLTQRVETGIAELAAAGRNRDLPPMLAIQSAVDATVSAPALIERLFDKLDAKKGNALILFDINRVARLDSILRLSFEQQIIPLLTRADLPFSLVLVTNATPDSADVVARTRGANGLVDIPLGISWPKGVFSLSHVALPIRPDDPIYGTAEAAEAARAAGGVGLPLGSLSLRGERGVLAISESLMVRMRHNPFYTFTEDEIVKWIGKAVGAKASGG